MAELHQFDLDLTRGKFRSQIARMIRRLHADRRLDVPLPHRNCPVQFHLEMMISGAGRIAKNDAGLPARRIKTSGGIRFFALLTVTFPLAPQTPAGDKKPNQTGQGWFPEVEFVASDVFRSGSYVQPLWKGLHFEGHYFGDPAANIGYTGADWMVRLKGFGLAPGFGATFGGSPSSASPAVTFRWDFERGWLVTQGLIIKSLSEIGTGEANLERRPNMKRARISDRATWNSVEES